MNEKHYSWGRFPPHAQIATPCHWRADVYRTLADTAAQHGTVLPFGNGRSYGDSCQATSNHVIHLRQLNRLIAVNWETGLVRAEAGVTLDEMTAVSIPRGWFLPVTPGTRFVTLGGALANDVHGKNHHVQGTFGCHVRSFGLIRSDQPPMTCSRHENEQLFAATIGGMGLTGVVEWVELQLMRIQSSLIDVMYVRFGSVDEFFDLSKELDGKYEYTVAWIDCLAKGKSSGRGVYMAGNHARDGSLAVANRGELNIPIVPPFSLVNRLSLRLFNFAYYRSYRAERSTSRASYASFFYPLDRIANWNKFYGPRGFQQYQCVIPDANAPAAVRALLEVIAAAHSGSFLAVLKRFGTAVSPGLLSFPLPGATLALDFPQEGEATTQLFSRLDCILRESGGRLYPAKDAHMSGDDFRSAYPQWSTLASFRDPLLKSKFWERVTRA